MFERIHLLAIALLTALIMPITGQAARPLGPPIEELTSGYHIAIAARAIERIDGGRVRFERVASFSNESPESIVLRTGEGDTPEIDSGRVYVPLSAPRERKNAYYREIRLDLSYEPQMTQICTD